MRRLTDRELQEKRDKGLCFRCDEKWNINHQCKRKELSVLLMNEEEGEMEETNHSLSVEEDDLALGDLSPLPIGISLNSVMGFDNPKTMKLRGMINGEEVIVLADPGATHNFISHTTIGRLEIPVVGNREFGVTLGNGEAVRGVGQCKDVLLSFNGVTICEDFLPLELGSTDVILGIQWLEKLGEVTTNWKLQVMSFWLNGQEVLLRVDKVTIIPSVLEGIVNEFAQVFEMPDGLPPSREKEHSIVLKEGSNPVYVRPYRYPQSQKDEIEKLIRDMLRDNTTLNQPLLQPSDPR